MVVGPTQIFQGVPPLRGFNSPGVCIYFIWIHGPGDGFSGVTFIVFRRFSGGFVDDCVSFHRACGIWDEVSSFTFPIISGYRGVFYAGGVVCGLRFRGYIIGFFLAKTFARGSPLEDFF